jgi:predicted PurR-regulated permease PerM
VPNILSKRLTLLLSGIAGFVVLSLFFPYIAQAVLIVFAAILLAILLRSPIDWMSKNTPLSSRWSFITTILLMLGIFSLIGWLIVPEILSQLEQLTQQIPEVLKEINQSLRQYSWAKDILAQPLDMPGGIPNVQEVESMLGRISEIFSGTFGFLANLVVIAILGVYLAFEPDVYIKMIIKILPPDSRQRAGEILTAIGTALKWWLTGRFIAMVILGVLVSVGIALLRLPLALGLGIITGLLSFVPIIGSILAVVPAALVALAKSPEYLLYILLLYTAAQGIETYFLTPFVQRKTVLMPPALALILQLFMGILLGPFGIALAYPIAVVGQVLIKTMYIEDVLNESVKIMPG